MEKAFSISQFSLEGKVALVTGASYGIGFEIAKTYAEAGATIAFNDIHQELVDKGLAHYKEADIQAHGCYSHDNRHGHTHAIALGILS